MTKEIITIEKVFELIRNGERRKGIEFLYSYHYNKLYGIAFSIVKNESMSQDIVNNTIYKLLKLELEKFPQNYESSWLYAVVKNEALMLLRKEKSVISFEKIAPIAVEDRAIQDYIDMDVYYSMVKNLSEEQRQIVTLKVLGGYTHKEISKMLGKPIGTVQWIYNTSLKKLKIVFTSLLMVIISTGIGFVARLVSYIQVIGGGANSMLPGGSNQDVQFDYLIIFFGLLFIATMVAFIVLYKKTDKIPTKADKKSISFMVVS